MAIRVFCGWCSEHAFRVDINTVDVVGTLWMLCPECGRATAVPDDFPRGLVVRPTSAEAAAPTIGDDGPMNEREWVAAATRNPAFADLSSSEEDVYSIENGKPFGDEG